MIGDSRYSINERNSTVENTCKKISGSKYEIIVAKKRTVAKTIAFVPLSLG
ncbi:MAG: hypothetical protein PWQ49_1037 [Methanohalophilus sp.]|nr:hypothetical protein [Methanohalophilus sp.]